MNHNDIDMLIKAVLELSIRAESFVDCRDFEPGVQARAAEVATLTGETLTGMAGALLLKGCTLKEQT